MGITRAILTLFRNSLSCAGRKEVNRKMPWTKIDQLKYDQEQLQHIMDHEAARDKHSRLELAENTRSLCEDLQEQINALQECIVALEAAQTNPAQDPL